MFLAKALAENKVITNLDLSSNMLGPKSARALGDMLLETSSIKHLNLEGNPLSIVQHEEGLSGVASMGANKAAFPSSSEALRRDSYLEGDASTSLNSPMSEFPREIIPIHSFFLSSLTLQCQLFYLIKNPLRVEVVLDYSGIEYFAQALEDNTSLLVLNLTRCMLHEDGGAAITKSMEKNETLVALEVGRMLINVSTFISKGSI